MTRPAAAFFLGLVLYLPSAYGQVPSPHRTVLDGVYSDAQVARGRNFYTAACGACHGNNLDGVSAPALTGDRFIERWREGMLDGVYDFIKERMPPARDGNPGAIPDNNYLDILTYILKTNGYPSGVSELTTDGLESVMFVGKNGPRPVPDGALVVTAGCLTQVRDGVWSLSSATEPARTKTSTMSTPAELLTSSQRSLGALSFRLVDLEAVPNFVPEAHRGHKVQAKGYLIRQPNAERISLSSVEMLDSTCVPHR